jgi:hypothetical protein
MVWFDFVYVGYYRVCNDRKRPHSAEKGEDFDAFHPPPSDNSNNPVLFASKPPILTQFLSPLGDLRGPHGSHSFAVFTCYTAV